MLYLPFVVSIPLDHETSVTPAGHLPLQATNTLPFHHQSVMVDPNGTKDAAIAPPTSPPSAGL